MGGVPKGPGCKLAILSHIALVNMKIPKIYQGGRGVMATPVLLDSAPPATGSILTPALEDEELLDAYSRTITNAAAKAGQAVVNIRVGRPQAAPQAARGQESGGSGFIVAPD